MTPGEAFGHPFEHDAYDRRLAAVQARMVGRGVEQTRAYGVGVSETVAVTDTGAEVLTNFSRALFVRG
jgi:Xaa-Pro aminopeptidase